MALLATFFPRKSWNPPFLWLPSEHTQNLYFMKSLLYCLYCSYSEVGMLSPSQKESVMPAGTAVYGLVLLYACCFFLFFPIFQKRTSLLFQWKWERGRSGVHLIAWKELSAGIRIFVVFPNIHCKCLYLPYGSLLKQLSVPFSSLISLFWWTSCVTVKPCPACG